MISDVTEDTTWKDLTTLDLHKNNIDEESEKELRNRWPGISIKLKSD